jgi:2-polyprenyl-6-methoxyphenol hydroxylase-like FAD-dependent oxidoreductase
MRNRYDAIIIGAGPAGSSAAIFLAQAGWSVALIEKQVFPRRKVCGECLAASNLPLLDELGLAPAFAELAGPSLTKVALMHADRSVCAPLPASSDSRYPWGRALGREHLDTLLLKRAESAGATIFQPWMVQSVEGAPGHFQCVALSLKTKERIVLNAPILIAAYGSWEAGSMPANAERTQRDSDLFAFKANFSDSKLEDGLLPVLAFPGGYGGMVVGDHAVTTLACCIRRDRLRECRLRFHAAHAGESVESYLMMSCQGVRKALEGAQRQDRWLAIGPIHPGIRMPRQGGNIFMVGNAAGEAHPIIGEGMSMALQSSWMLCRLLIANPLIIKDAHLQRQVLNEYARAWHRNFAQRIRLAAGFAHLAMRPATSGMLLPLVRAWPDLLTHAANWCGKVRQPHTSFRKQALGIQIKEAELFQSD